MADVRGVYGGSELRLLKLQIPNNDLSNLAVFVLLELLNG
jgi:hypothetical protein